MKKSIFRKVAFFVAMTLTATAFTACSSGSSGSSSSNSSSKSDDASYASYWTDGQKKTIDSLKKIDNDGYLYEVDYNADYSIDDIIKPGISNTTDMRKSFQSLYLSDSENDIPKIIYGSGCSAFATKNDKGEQIMGRNYDWNKDEEVAVAVHTSPKNGYKSVSMADLGFIGVSKGFSSVEEKENILYAPLFATDGINEKGLACTVLILEEDGTKQATDKEKVISGMVVRLILDNASTVKEAEEVISKYDIVSDFYKSKDEDSNGGNDFHWLVTDKEGNSAVFEFVDNKLVVNTTPINVETDMEKLGSMSIADINKNVKLSYPKEDTGYMLVTNFYVSEGYTNTNGEGYWRYGVLSDSLKSNPNPTNEEAMKYLESVKYGMNDVDFKTSLKAKGGDPTDESQWAWITVWSEVFDTSDLSMNLCLREDYTKTYKFTVK